LSPDASIGAQFVMLSKKLPTRLRFGLLYVASQTKIALSRCYASLESFLRGKWQMIHPASTPPISTHLYEVRPRADKHGVDLIGDALRFGPLWYAGANSVSNAIGFAKFFSRSHHAVISVYDEAGNVIEAHEHVGDLATTPCRGLSVSR
jgi:hypothetical protein